VSRALVRPGRDPRVSGHPALAGALRDAPAVWWVSPWKARPADLAAEKVALGDRRPDDHRRP